MDINPILLASRWIASPGCSVQVLPHPKDPGVFLGRIIVHAGAAGDFVLPPRVTSMLACPEITVLQVYLESSGHAGQPAKLSVTDLLGLAPAPLAGSSRVQREFYLLSPGSYPQDPEYPVWTRDPTRSWQVVAGKYAEIVPLTFEFVPTLNCIYRCHQCAYRDPKERLGLWQRNDFSPRFHMDESTMKVLLSRLKEANVEEILFTGGGEPLLDDATPVGMRYARQELGFPKVGLYTNGALLDATKAGSIMAAAPDYVRVSLNAGGRDVYYRHHNPLEVDGQPDYFATCHRSLEYLAREKIHLGSKTSLGVSYLLDPDNTADVVNAARLVSALAAKYPGAINYMRFTPSVNYFGAEQHAKAVFDSAVALIEREAVPQLAAAQVEPVVYAHRFGGLYEPRPYDKCLAAGWYGGIGPGGVLYWCCEKLFNPSFAFGSLLDSSFEELWQGPQRRRVMSVVGEAVQGGTASPCPVVCKPHEHNKVFAKIERLRDQGRIEIVRVWLQQVQDIIHSKQQDAKPRLFGFQS